MYGLLVCCTLAVGEILFGKVGCLDLVGGIYFDVALQVCELLVVEL